MKTLAANGAGDLFPAFSKRDEEAKITKEGKIPVHASWKDRVKAGTASWTASSPPPHWRASTQDQQALDDRIRRFA